MRIHTSLRLVGALYLMEYSLLGPLELMTILPPQSASSGISMICRKSLTKDLAWWIVPWTTWSNSLSSLLHTKGGCCNLYLHVVEYHGAFQFFIIDLQICKSRLFSFNCTCSIQYSTLKHKTLVETWQIPIIGLETWQAYCRILASRTPEGVLLFLLAWQAYCIVQDPCLKNPWRCSSLSPQQRFLVSLIVFVDSLKT